MSEPTPADNTTMVFNALSDEPVSAKSVQVATGLTYKQVTTALEVLEARGTATRTHVGTRTLWSIAADVAPVDAAPVDAPLVADATDAEPVADEPADADEPEPVDDGRKKVQEMTKAELLAEANDEHGLNLAKSSTKPVLVAAVTDARNAAYQARLAHDALVQKYDAMKAPEVKALAKERQIPGYTSMKKADLVAALVALDEAPADETPAEASQTSADAPAAPDGPWGTPGAVAAPSGSLGAVLAEMQAVAPVSAPPAQAPRRPRADGAPAGGIVSSGQARAWARGELETTIVATMQAAPDREWSPTEMTKHLNGVRTGDGPIAQAGSVAFAMDQAVKRGTLRLTQDKPKRYAVAAAVLPA